MAACHVVPSGRAAPLPYGGMDLSTGMDLCDRSVCTLRSADTGRTGFGLDSDAAIPGTTSL